MRASRLVLAAIPRLATSIGSGPKTLRAMMGRQLCHRTRHLLHRGLSLSPLSGYNGACLC